MIYKYNLLAFLFLISIFTYAQSDLEEKLVGEGISLHDKGEFKAAIAKYDKALSENPESILALGEKAYSLMMLNKYEEVIKTCKKCFKIAPNSDELKTIYTTYANSYDMMGQPGKALKAYDEGLEVFPDYYHLYFNKGITLTQMEKYDKAITNFEKAVKLNPKHPGSLNALARVLYVKGMKIPALMVFSRFYIIEPEGKRAQLNMPYIEDITKGNAQKTGRNSVTINLDATALPEEGELEKQPNDFKTISLILTLNSGMGLTGKNKKKNEVELFHGNIETVCSSLEELKKENFGLYWDYFAPYFIEMKNKGYTETFSYIVYASSGEKYVEKWIDKNNELVNSFYDWSSGYEWEK